MVPMRYAWVSDITVRRECQRSGIGRALMEEVNRWVKAREASQTGLNVWDFNTGAKRFYKSLGYTTSSQMMWKLAQKGGHGA
jgi:ribosomal protein S18 acetylase RimI-like enzyme